MNGYTLTRAADADLADIARDTTKRWGDEQMERYLLILETTFQALAAFPDSGRPFPARPGYFLARSGSHVIFYTKGPDAIVIARVLHHRMEPGRHLPSSRW